MHWQAHSEFCATQAAGMYADVAMMGQNDLADNCQAQAYTTGTLGEEGIENLLALCLWNAWTVVGHRDEYLPILRNDADLDMAALLQHLDSVKQEIEQYLRDLFVVAGRESGLGFATQADVLFLCLHAQHGYCLLGQVS